MTALRRRPKHFPLLLAGALLTLGWGSTGHRIINTQATDHLPGSMLLFVQDSTYFGQHASDADNRKGSDTSEEVKHYIDLENFASFRELTANLDSVIALYGWPMVKETGILPWATVWAYDSLVTQLARGDWTKAVLTASDLGHYVADGHQGLHATVNYNGQLTGNTGIHSRYESGMVNLYQNSLVITPGSTSYIADRFAYVLSFCVASNALVDSILRADTYAKAVSGWSGSGSVPTAYYNALWSRTGSMTRDQFQRASVSLASLWYSAWVDAGLISPSSVAPPFRTLPATLRLQNYPNPFNPTTTFAYELPVGGTVDLTLFTADGRQVATLASGIQGAGRHTLEFDGQRLASGVYLCRLRLGRFVETRRVLLLR